MPFEQGRIFAAAECALQSCALQYRFRLLQFQSMGRIFRLTTGRFSATVVPILGPLTSWRDLCDIAPDAGHASAMPEQGSVPKTGPALGMLAAGAQAMPLWRRDEAIPSQ